MKGGARSSRWRKLDPGDMPSFHTHSIHLTFACLGRNQAPKPEPAMQRTHGPQNRDCRLFRVGEQVREGRERILQSHALQISSAA